MAKKKQTFSLSLDVTDPAYSMAIMLHALQASMATLRSYDEHGDIPLTPDQILSQLQLIEFALMQTLVAVDT